MVILRLGPQRPPRTRPQLGSPHEAQDTADRPRAGELVCALEEMLGRSGSAGRGAFPALGGGELAAAGAAAAAAAGAGGGGSCGVLGVVNPKRQRLSLG